ncbi:MAG: hypothetical protein C5B49_07070 [Bdellovibrio sp.]|nr:MAG: hypothetical protein C5B49_07070 [Bdellovibrio sp.]
MNDNQVQSIILFFRLAFMNSTLAQKASQETHRAIENQLKKKMQQSFEVLFVRQTANTFHRLRMNLYKTKRRADTHLLEVPAMNLGPWRDFLRQTPDEEILALLWVHILQLPILAVAQGLSVTEGTVRHRLSRAVRILSGKLEPLEAQTVRAVRPWK